MRAIAFFHRGIPLLLAIAIVVAAPPAVAQQGAAGAAPTEPAPTQPAPDVPPAEPAPSAPAPAPEPPVETTAPTTAPEAAPVAPEAAAPGIISLSVRVQDALIAGAEVLVDGQAAGTTSSEAAVQLSLGAGAHTLRIVIPPAAMPERADQATALGVDVPINVVAGQPQEVNLAINAKGEVLALDVHPTVVTDAAPQPEQQAPETEKGLPAKLTGRIVLSTTREPIVGAKVYVRRTSFEGVTDAAGMFTIDLPAGSYDLAIVHPNYATAIKDKVRVSIQKHTQLLIELTPSTTEPDDFTITAKYVRGGVAALMEERRNASTVQDAIGSEDIAKSPDSTASSATRRVVGASIVGGQFLLVRGLGGRYSNVRLNGVPLPSTDPDLPGFQIDLFPASLLSNLTITKTFSADIPGDFAGGSLNVVTKDFPDKFTLGMSLGASYNTETTGRKILNYEGGDTDLLGFDDGTRSLPDGVPDEHVVASRTSNFDDTQTRAVGRLFANRWHQNRTTALPNLSLSASLGDTHQITEDRRFGYLLTLGYRVNFQRYNEEITRVIIDTGNLRVRDQFKREIGDQEAQLGALGTASFEPAKDHKLTLVSLLTQTANDQTSYVTGRVEGSGLDARSTQFRFIERQLLFNQLLGEHKNLAGPMKLNWQLNMALVSRDQPDTRDVTYSQLPAGEYTFTPGTNGSGQRLYSELGQQDFGGGLDLTVPLWAATGKTGYMGRISERHFTARRFLFSHNQGVATFEDLAQPPEQLFDPSNFDEPDPLLEFEEASEPLDGYNADQDAHAGYVTLDVPVFEDTLRLLPGVRAEWFRQKIESEAPYSNSTDPTEGTSKSDFDWLPAGAAVVNLSDKMAIRGGYGGTVARPLLRELAPFVNQDYVRRRTIQGNPDLQRTFIHNFDLRWELFPSGTEVLAASAFYKIFEHPIESVVLDNNGSLGFDNIDGADNYGLELETRFSLERFSDALRNFSVLANLALIRSEVRLSPEQQSVATTRKRPLAGQSPYVANLSFGYSSEENGLSAYVYYNVFGRRLQDVGREGLPDIYEEPFHSVDLSGFWKIDSHWTLGVSGTNLLMQPTVVKQGDFNYSKYNKGSTYGAKLAWSY